MLKKFKSVFFFFSWLEGRERDFALATFSGHVVVVVVVNRWFSFLSLSLPLPPLIRPLSKAHSVFLPNLKGENPSSRTSAMRGDLAEGGGGLTGAAAESVDGDARVARDRREEIGRGAAARERGRGATTTAAAAVRRADDDDDEGVGAADAVTRGDAEREARMAFASLRGRKRGRRRAY